MVKEKPQPTKEENIFANRKYIRAVGRRKSSTAQVKIFGNGKGTVLINRLPLKKYFGHFELEAVAVAPLEAVGKAKDWDVAVTVKGGGKRGQAGAMRLGIARALVLSDEKLKPTLRKLGYMTVDARVKERKKPGLKGARRAPQWAKR
ncbi:MAG: 30S ribosomal protein S9 [Patescibacteria group bacterium]|mgnify:CR=1 FL=1